MPTSTLKDLCVERFGSPVWVNVEIYEDGRVIPLAGFSSFSEAVEKRREYLKTMPPGRVFKRSAFKTVKVEYFKARKWA